MASQTDGAHIGLGVAGNRNDLLRFSAGAHDQSYGDGSSFLGGVSSRTIALDDSDRVVSTVIALGLRRHLSDGSPDVSFGNMGVLELVLELLPADVAIDGQQRILAAGRDGSLTAAVLRIHADGTIDDTFGTDGGVTLGTATQDSDATAILVDADGAIVLSGVSGADDAFVARLNDDGSPDLAFGNGGLSKFVGLPIRPDRIVPRQTGGYLASGYASGCVDGSQCRLIVLAVDLAGNLDSTFGAFGTVDLDAAFDSTSTGLLELQDGSIVLAGGRDRDGAEELTVWRIAADGKAYTTFAGGGVFSLPGRGRGTSIVPDGDGVLVGGWQFAPESGTDVVLLRFAPQ
jgi:uncharacterized delta-60 repeat protein